VNILTDEFIKRILETYRDKDLKIILLTEDADPVIGPGTITNISELESYEVSPSGNYNSYPNGKSLENKSVSNGKLIASDVDWQNTTITARFAVIYDNSDGLVIAIFDFGTNRSSDSGEFRISWSASGIINFAQA